MDLRRGEEIVHVVGGPCTVCKGRILEGKAVQLSKYTARIRHLECMPKTDSRSQSTGNRAKKGLPE
jgi:hypothetical protein